MTTPLKSRSLKKDLAILKDALEELELCQKKIEEVFATDALAREDDEVNQKEIELAEKVIARLKRVLNDAEEK